MKHELWYSVVVRDRNGKVVSRERRKSRSFLKQWNQFKYVGMQGMYGDFDEYIKDTGGVIRLVTGSNPQDLLMKASVGVTSIGIRVGTGDTPVAIDDYALETPIAEGEGAGQMSHLACVVYTPVVAPPSCYFVVSRSILNYSPGTITVRELAAYFFGWATQYYCGIRDVLDTPQAIEVGGAITVNYTIQVTV